MTKLTLYTKADCCLCEEAEHAIERARIEFEFELERIDISADRKLTNLYGELIPVVFVNERRAFELRVDERELRHLLAKADGRQPTNGIAGVA